jgi:molybdopterin biosynthesis enzyme
MAEMLRAGVRTVALAQVMEGYFAEEFQQHGKAGTKMTLEEKSKVRTYSATDRDHEMLEVVARYHGISKSAMITGLVRKEFWRIFPSGTESIRPEEGARITS